jgi:N-dimethylarginine dimethylaminohydrolase
MLEPEMGLPDMCFTRDIAVATPFGQFALNPALPHRQTEVDAFVAACRRWQLPVRRITAGPIEGGDVCVARDGLLLVGMSGERSSAAGIDAFSGPFRAAGWEILTCPFDADYLHLDTIFCMLDTHEAIGCIELLDPTFVKAVAAHGINIIPAPTRSAASLGCNVLSLGNRRIVASTTDEIVIARLRSAGYFVDTVDISQFAACGGGIHCLTQPICRV